MAEPDEKVGMGCGWEGKWEGRQEPPRHRGNKQS